MSVPQPTGLTCADLFRNWAMASVPVPRALDDLRGCIELYQPDDLPEMIEILREAEHACRAGLDDVKTLSQNERQQRSAQNTEHRLSIIVHAESFGQWGRRIQFLQEVRHFLEREWQSYQTDSASN